MLIAFLPCPLPSLAF